MKRKDEVETLKEVIRLIELALAECREYLRKLEEGAPEESGTESSGQTLSPPRRVHFRGRPESA